MGLKFQPVGADPVFRQIGSELCQIVEYPVGVRKLLIVGAKPSLLFGIDDWHPCTPPGTPRCLESLTVDQSVMRPPGPVSKEYRWDEHPSHPGVFCVL